MPHVGPNAASDDRGTPKTGQFDNREMQNQAGFPLLNSGIQRMLVNLMPWIPCLQTIF